MDLLAFQRTGERDRIGCDLSDQVRAPASWQFAGLLDFLFLIIENMSPPG
jgi:hypothetical protein